MDEIQEQMDIATEISTAISQPLGAAAYDDVRISQSELDRLY